MYYLKLDNKLNRTIEKAICKNYYYGKIIDFLKSNNINQSCDIEIAIYKDYYYYSYYYAFYVLKSRFKLGEPAIAKNSNYSYWYAKDVIKDRFHEAEVAIATNAYWSYKYARNVIKGRFKLGEQIIKNSKYEFCYEKHFGIKL